MVNPLQPQTLAEISEDLVVFKDLVNEREGVLAKATILPSGQVIMTPIGRRMQSVTVLKSLLKIKEQEAKKILGRLREGRDENEVPVFVTRLGEKASEFAVVRINEAA